MKKIILILFVLFSIGCLPQLVNAQDADVQTVENEAENSEEEAPKERRL